MTATADGPLALYVTNITPYFLSHRLALAQEARARGFRIALVCGDVDQHGERLASEGILPLKTSPVGRGVSPLGDLKAAWGLADHIRKTRPAVVHASGLKTILLCALAGRITRLPNVVCLITGLGATYINDSPKSLLLRRVIETAIRPLLTRATVVFQNADDRDYFLARRICRADNSLVIKGSGVDPEEYAFHPEPKDDPPVVVLPARLLKSKGVVEFAEAAAMLKARGVSARFALVGDLDPANPDALTEQELEALVRSGAVESWGYRKDMAAVFAEANLVCLPSYREGLPKALIEAASCGRAIVTTDVPGCREIVDHDRTGLIVPVKNPAALADAMEALLSDPDRRRDMGRAGRAMVEAECSHAVVTRRTADLYAPGKPPASRASSIAFTRRDKACTASASA